jgi:broad specificity phosphatase PhoE
MLFLVRHGTTVQNMLRPPGDFTPATQEEWALDHELSEKGRAESEALRPRFQQMMAVDRVLVSPKARTQETARLALPGVPFEIEERLHEWHIGEPAEVLLGRARWLLQRADSDVIAAFTHGGFIRAVIASVLVGDESQRFEATFHDLRRMLHIWNASITIIGQGGSGLEVIGVNLCPAVEAIAGR